MSTATHEFETKPDVFPISRAACKVSKYAMVLADPDSTLDQVFDALMEAVDNLREAGFDVRVAGDL